MRLDAAQRLLDSHHGNSMLAVKDQEQYIKCAGCGCGRNLAWWRWCKHCKRPLGPPPAPRSAPSGGRPAGRGARSPARGGGRPWREDGTSTPRRSSRGGGQWRESSVAFDPVDEIIPSDGGGRHDAEEDRLVKLVELLEQAGDIEAADDYRIKLEGHRKTMAESGISVEVAKQYQDDAEEALSKAIQKYERLDKLLETAHNDVTTLEEDLDVARARYQAAVRRLHSSVVAPTSEPKHAVAEPDAGPPRINLERLLEGDELLLDDGNLFGIEDLGEEVSETDRQEARQRKQALEELFKKAATEAFGPLRAKAAEIRAEQQQQKKRLAAKRCRTEEAEAPKEPVKGSEAASAEAEKASPPPVDGNTTEKGATKGQASAAAPPAGKAAGKATAPGRENVKAAKAKLEAGRKDKVAETLGEKQGL